MKKIAFFFENLYNSPNTADKMQILKKGAFFMDEFGNQKKCQTYEVTDFQHNFEITHPTTTLQQWGLHIHSTHYELLVFIRGNAECWIEGRRKKLSMVM